MRGGEREPVVLATVPYYFPGFMGGGKPVALRNLIAALCGEFRFKVMTINHDLGEHQRYSGVEPNRWIAREHCEAFYLEADRDVLRTIREQLSSDDYDLLYLNTVFSRLFGIIPLMLLRFGAIARKPLVIAPRGEFASGALAIKSKRKKSFLAAARALRLFDGAMWQASGAEEARDIRAAVGLDASIISTPDIPAPEYRKSRPSSYRKVSGALDILFLSRITPVKNLYLAIEALRGVEGRITFRIAGPIDDTQYWARCQMQIVSLGSHVRSEYLGPIAGSEVSNLLSRHGLLFLPTAGESFGFVILEAMLAGCPVLISDRTPWRDLAEKGVGWDLPVSRIDRTRAALQLCIDMDPEAHHLMSVRAREFALSYIAREDSTPRHAALFLTALGEPAAARISA